MFDRIHAYIGSSVLAKYKTLLGVNAFILVFYGVFEPFHMGHYDAATKWKVILAYVLIASLVLGASFFILPKAVAALSTFRKKFRSELWLVWHLLAIGLCIFLFKISFGFYEITPARVATGIGALVALSGLLFLVISGVDKLALVASPENPHTHFTEEWVVFSNYKSETVLRLESTSILYIESVKNEVIVFYLDAQGSVQQKQFRQTLKNVLAQLKDFPGFIQTHRAFIANAFHAKLIDRQASKKWLVGDTMKVPVSRSFSSAVGKLF